MMFYVIVSEFVIRSLACLLLHSSFHLSLRLFVTISCVRLFLSFSRAFVRACSRSFVRSFVRTWVRLFVCSFVLPFVGRIVT